MIYESISKIITSYYPSKIWRALDYSLINSLWWKNDQVAIILLHKTKTFFIEFLKSSWCFLIQIF